MKKSLVLTLATISLSFNVLAAKHSYQETLSLDADRSPEFFADVGAGSLNIYGADVDEITVKATIYSKEYSSKDDLRDAVEEKMDLSLDRQGNKVVLKALAKQKWISFSNPNIAIDLDVQIPRSMDVEIDDSSGSMVIKNIDGNLIIDDGSGSTTIADISNNITLDDGSGSINITNVGGHVDINDGSGSITVNQVGGDVAVDDGSGSITVNDMKGQFKLVDDGSGGVRVNGKAWSEDD